MHELIHFIQHMLGMCGDAPVHIDVMDLFLSQNIYILDYVYFIRYKLFGV